MASIEETRQRTAGVLISDVQSILDEQSLDQDALAKIKTKLIEIASQSALWRKSGFPQSGGDQLHVRYLIAQAGDLTLYLNVMRPGNKTPPHNHTTWACIAAVAGEEQNYFYERLDDGSSPGKAELRQTTHVSVEPGTGITMMPDDIHHVEIVGDQAIRHLHLYGRPLESLDQRLSFNMAAGTCKVMDIGVKTQAIPGADQRP